MNRKQLFFSSLLTLALWISTPYELRAGGPPPNTTGATVRGSVRFEGKVPPGKAISMAADPSCAQQHPAPVMTQEVMADAKGDLQNVRFYCMQL